MPHWTDVDYIEKVRSLCKYPPSGCWEFTGGFEFKYKVDNGTPGYREMSYRGKNYRVHRLTWILFHCRPIPAGMVILHTCDNPPCCNPDHLKLGTRAENNKDMAAKGRYNNQKKTHCAQGHPYDEENTHLHHDPRGYIFRRCRQCNRDKYRRQSTSSSVKP